MDVEINISGAHARIENAVLAVEFDLSTGTYTGINKSDETEVFKDAWFRLGQGGWREPPYTFTAEKVGHVVDSLGTGASLRVWYQPEAKYDPCRFLDITVYAGKPFFGIGWGIKNDKAYTLRARTAEVLLDGKLFRNQKVGEPRVLRGGAGAEPNVVEQTWEIAAHNSAMLTYRDALSDNRRRTVVAGGLEYAEFMRSVEFHGAPEGTGLRAVDARCDGAEMSLEPLDHCIQVIAKSDMNAKVDIEVRFEH